MFLCRYLFFNRPQLVSTLSLRQEKSFCQEKFSKTFRNILKELIYHKRSNEKLQLFIEWKLFPGIQVSWTDHFMIFAKVNTWHLEDIYLA